MTEKEWFESNDVKVMLSVLADERKLRLFAVACVRQIWNLIENENSKKAVEIAEMYADGLATKEELDAAWSAANIYSNFAASKTSYDSAWIFAWNYANHNVNDSWHLRWSYAWNDVRSYQSKLLREIFGNPYKPLTLNPEWLYWNNNTIPKMAQNIYDNKDFGSMNILADALEDSGCNNQEILSHCRTTDHVKGCWVIDLILDKT